MIRFFTFILLHFFIYESVQRGPPGIASAPSNPVTAAPIIRRQPTVVQTTWAPPIEQSNTWQPQQQQQNNWEQGQENNQQSPDDRWDPDWRDRGPPPPDFEGWHHRPPWRRGPWWRRPPPPWGPPPPGPPPPPFGWRGI
uniref:Uncharacterized protein n=1 Tax=Caenorhabditis tropicalis TaxID=1561998 RepID=A0A1I7TQR0_9PELO